MISAQDVKRLRDMTGAGMMDCKKALEETGGDFEAATDFLRKQGQKVSAKRADREANDGVVATAVSDDGTAGAMIELNCETDFVARNEEFQSFAEMLARLALEEQPTDVDALKDLETPEGTTVSVALDELTGKIGEKIDVRQVTTVDAPSGGLVVDYVHPGARLGVLVSVTAEEDGAEVGRNVAMQIAAMSPIAVRREAVDAETQEKEMEIAREVARNEGKPDHIVDRIAQGKLDRFFKDNVLIEQAFVKDASMTVAQMLESSSADVHSFERFALGS